MHTCWKSGNVLLWVRYEVTLSVHRATLLALLKPLTEKIMDMNFKRDKTFVVLSTDRVLPRSTLWKLAPRFLWKPLISTPAEYVPLHTFNVPALSSPLLFARQAQFLGGRALFRRDLPCPYLRPCRHTVGKFCSHWRACALDRLSCQSFR